MMKKALSVALCLLASPHPLLLLFAISAGDLLDSVKNTIPFLLLK